MEVHAPIAPFSHLSGLSSDIGITMTSPTDMDVDMDIDLGLHEAGNEDSIVRLKLSRLGLSNV